MRRWRESGTLPGEMGTLIRHFGARAGKALILHNQGKRDEALAPIRAGPDIHPFLPERSHFPELVPPPIRS